MNQEQNIADFLNSIKQSVHETDVSAKDFFEDKPVAMAEEDVTLALKKQYGNIQIGRAHV